MTSLKKQKGIALITAMLIVSLVVIIAATLTTQQELDIRRTGNVLAQEQAWLYATGVEDWAKGVLKQDAKNSKHDFLAESWTIPLQPIEVDGGQLNGLIEDEQAKFNLNNLVKDGKASLPDMERFKRLLTALELDTNLVQAIVDWIDVNQETSFPNGAEDQFYSGQDISYRTADRPMGDISELRLIKDITGEIYRKLAPYVTALPEYTSININTAPEPVLMSIAEGVTASGASSIVTDRAESGFETIEAFSKHNALAGLTLEQAGLSVDSQYFRLSSTVEISSSIIKLDSLLARKSTGKVFTLARKRRSY
ncbi:MAG: type II secretion system minor pseudopilin GspK [Gammaproteobacteria bacterium]|nr:type II secretion system minor pseudopilin GspK [Gammaproteobacteria bacterium]MDH5614127.1 type II secretion system minor pseudopilin GspK [Gammaproteobacteria bacterium]